MDQSTILVERFVWVLDREDAMTAEDDRLMATRRLFAAIEAGDATTLRTIYAENAVQVEHPNRLKPKGDRRGIDKMMADLARGKAILREEHYEVLEAVAAGDAVGLQVKWTGILAVPVGALQPGDSMVCESGIFLKFAGDRVVEQHNYDCFEDFLTPR
jgi:ketosteroid isomerase-like protein